MTRVARVISVKGERALVRFIEGNETRDIDVSMVETKNGGYLEVFADQALSTLSAEEARSRGRLWADLRKPPDPVRMS